MALSTKPIKGARDFFPEEKRVQSYLFATIRRVCESFGYEEYDAPILEPTELYLNKGSEEIIKDQTYTFSDRANRSLTIRTEMTPSVARMVASRRQEIALPARWYSIPQCWRYERMQKGRGREFYQLNADIFGVSTVEADLEIIELADKILQAFKAPRSTYRIEISSRKLLDELAEKTGVSDTSKLIRLVDAKSKMSDADFASSLSELIKDKENTELALYVLNLKSFEGIRSGLNFDSIDKIGELIRNLESRLGIDKVTNIVFNPATARGFDYYNDIVFEVFDNNPENNRSMFGGGRYDNLLSLFDVDQLPAVGFGMGDITLLNFLQSNNLLPEIKTETDLYVVIVGDTLEASRNIIKELRDSGLNVAIDMTNRKIEKQIKSASKNGIQYVLFIGDEEIKTKKLKLKDIIDGSEQSLDVSGIIAYIK